MPPDVRDLGAVSIPDDGQEHRCACGHGGYSVWDGDGWLRRGRYVVTDDEGRTVSSCHSCDRELVAALHWQLSSGGSPTADPIEPNNEGER